MRLLLDTHILLWWLTNDPALPAQADALITDPANEIGRASCRERVSIDV